MSSKDNEPKKLTPDIDPQTGNFISRQGKREKKTLSRQAEVARTIEHLKKLKADNPSFYPQTIQELKVMASGGDIDPSIKDGYQYWTAKDFIDVLQSLGEDVSAIEQMVQENLTKLKEKANQPTSEFADEILAKIFSFQRHPSQPEIDKLTALIINNRDLRQYVFNYLNNQGTSIDSEKAEYWISYLQGRIDQSKT